MGHVALRARRWYQAAVVWDKPSNYYRLYLNGVRVGASTQFAPLVAHQGGDTLYAGSTALALSGFAFYETPLDDEGMAMCYTAEETQPDNPATDELCAHYRGDKLPAWSFAPDATWQSRLDLSLRDRADLAEFYVQGNQDAPRITPEGLLIETRPARTPKPAGWDPLPPNEMFDIDQVYLWTRRAFEGDLAVDYEFMPLKEGGLSLLMTQVTGMQREDFMADHRLRKSGAMRMVCWENVRNYHWEYFREMDDCRHDVGSHLLVKNPWMRPLTFQCHPERIAVGRWHRLQFVQEGARLRGTLDGRLIFDVQDKGFSNNGAVGTAGHIALRCMFKTRLLVRDLRVWNRPPFFTTVAAL